MQRTYHFRLYPTKDNEERLFFTLNKCRFVYNKLLEGLNNKKKRSELQASLVGMKEQFPELKQVHSKVLQMENYRLFSNLRALSKSKKKGRKAGSLRFKGRNWFKTFSYNQTGYEIIKVPERYDKLKLSKIGEIPFVMHREIEGKIKQVTIKHYPSKKWYASIICENNAGVAKTENNKKVGIDLGIKNFVFDSDGNRFDSPKALHNSLDKLAKEQRKLSRKKKGSQNREKQKIKVAIIHEKITNQRNDFLHKISRRYINNYGFIAVENLHVSNMVRNRCLAKSISDVSWSRFIQMLEYKAENAGVQVVKLNPKYTSQICSSCGNIVKKSLQERTHKCSCGLEMDRDLNAAINILKLGQELSFEPLELGTLPSEQKAIFDNESGSPHPSGVG